MLNGLYLKFLLNLGLKIFPINKQTQKENKVAFAINKMNFY